MALVRQWLIGVTCAALLAAIADGLMPQGPIKQIGKLVCALVLLCVVLRPVLSPQITQRISVFDRLEEQAKEQKEQLREQSDALLKESIERECGAYIVDKAAQLDIDCQVRVECVPGTEGMWLPAVVRIDGQLDATQRQALSREIETELGLDTEHQIYIGGG